MSGASSDLEMTARTWRSLLRIATFPMVVDRAVHYKNKISTNFLIMVFDVTLRNLPASAILCS